MEIRLPNHWTPRPDQMPLWRYMHSDAPMKRAFEVAHRRWGKDEVGLHYTACAAHERPGVYWHLLPEATQARKAIWDAVNPRTGRRRIDEAFPLELRKVTRENEMFIRFKCGSTWQVVGSDNFDSLVGTPPVGIVFSEWALSNPRAWSYLRPILAENKGWALFITTPRGRNHAATMYESAQGDPAWFCEKRTADDTPVFDKDTLARERAEYIREMGEHEGEALFRQEYYCDFTAPIIGSYYGQLIDRLDTAGQLCRVDYDPIAPVDTAWDIGRSDACVVWFFQRIANEIRIIDYLAKHGSKASEMCQLIKAKTSRIGDAYAFGTHWLPWDAIPATFAAEGKSILEQVASHLGRSNVKIAPNLDKQDGRNAVRTILPKCWFDRERCADGIDALRHYRRAWDEKRRAFAVDHYHDWASDPADAFRMLAVSYTKETNTKIEPTFRNPTWDELMAGQQMRYSEARIA